jgi:hypothetical protein
MVDRELELRRIRFVLACFAVSVLFIPIAQGVQRWAAVTSAVMWAGVAAYLEGRRRRQSP